MSALVIDIADFRRPIVRDDRAGARCASPRGAGPRRAAPSSTARQAEVGLRLTARGRLVVVVLALTAALGVTFASQQAAAGQAPPAVPVATHTVAAGETLWQIAGEVAGAGADVRETVSTLMDLNGLDSAALTAGQELLVPAP